MQIVIKDKLYNDIKSYCDLNQLEISEYINDLLTKSFMVDKYGERPNIAHNERNKKVKSVVLTTQSIVPEKPLDTVNDDVVIETTPLEPEKKITRRQLTKR